VCVRIFFNRSGTLTVIFFETSLINSQIGKKRNPDFKMKLLHVALLCIETFFFCNSTVNAVHHHQFSYAGFNGNIDQIANEFQLINNAAPYTLQLNHKEKSSDSDIVISSGLESKG